MALLGEIYIEQITNQWGLSQLETEWRALLKRSGQDNLFLTWEWLSCWWRSFGLGSGLFLLCARDSTNRLVGLAPLRITHRKSAAGIRLRIIEFLGSGSPVWSDDLELITERGKERAVTEAIGLHLLKCQKDWDVLWLTDFTSGSLSVAFLLELFRSAGFNSTTQSWAVCPYLPLVQAWEVYEERAQRKFRDLKKYLRALDMAGAKFCVVETQEMLEDALCALVKLNQKRIEGKDDIPSLSNPTFCTFVKEFSRAAFRRGWLRLYYIAVGDELIAVNLNFVYGHRVYGYLSGFEPAWQRHGVGTCLFRHVIQQSWKTGSQLYDFLRGDEPYKYRWTSEQRQTFSLRLINHQGRYAAFRATEYAGRALKRLWQIPCGLVRGVR